MKQETEYEKQKQKNKQKLVRNEFLSYGKSNGRYEFPIIQKQDIDVDKIEFLSFANAKMGDQENQSKTIHFFTYDWKFDKVYENAQEEVEKLKQYYAVLSPDFSMFTNMPLALQIYSVFKNRWCGAYWQSQGLKVIPTVSWGDERTFDFCFEGIEEGSVVCVCTYYRENCEEEFMLGYNEMLKRIKPSMVLCYDEPFPSMKGNIKEFLPTTFEWTKNLSWSELARFKWEKRNKNVLGLDKKDFKYFEYEDPHEKIALQKCDVCGEVVSVDQFGFGDCSNCGWCQDPDALKSPDRVQYPNRISLNKAKMLYSKNKKLEPDFDDFIAGLLMYSEMEFYYNKLNYGVVLYGNKQVEFFENQNPESLQTFENIDEFKKHANINGKLLKDVWPLVKNADYMQG